MVRHHLHVRIAAREYAFLVSLAGAADDSLASCVRQLIRAAMRSRTEGTQKSGTAPVPFEGRRLLSMIDSPGQ
jgi:hypothetical protein